MNSMPDPKVLKVEYQSSQLDSTEKTIDHYLKKKKRNKRNTFF